VFYDSLLGLGSFWVYRDPLAHEYRFSRRSAHKYWKRLKAELGPFFGDKKLSCVTIDDLKRLSNQLVARGLAVLIPWLFRFGAWNIMDHFKNHVRNRHGNRKIHGAVTVTDADFHKMPAMVTEPDMAIIGANRAGLCNVYVKIECGMTWFYFDNMLDSKRNKVLQAGCFIRCGVRMVETHPFDQ